VGVQAFTYQIPWRHCKKCQGLSWGPALSFSKCPAGGKHVETCSLPYFLQYRETPNDPAPPASMYQNEWRHCKKCQGLSYNGQGVLGWCPAGGHHNHTDSHDYYLPHDSDDIPVYRQGGWRYCDKCNGLFYGPGQNASWCPKAGQHHAATTSYDYRIRYDAFGENNC